MSKSKRVKLPQNIKVAFYCRVACEDNDAITLQKSLLQHYAERQGYKNLSFYEDNGVSGISYTRPALLRLEADIQAGIVDTVIVRSIDRIGRNFIETEDWITKIRRKGVSFISVSEGITDTSFKDRNSLTHELYKVFLYASRKNRRVMRRS